MCNKAQEVLQNIAGLENAVVVRVYHGESGPSVDATLDNGEVWSIQPGPDTMLTIVSPDGLNMLAAAQGDRK